MIGYLRFRREAIACCEDPSFRDYLTGATYRVKARLLHGVGRHTHQEWGFGTGRMRCTWCGHMRP